LGSLRRTGEELSGENLHVEEKGGGCGSKIDNLHAQMQSGS
jgi:hypothetical protein